jgi:hypothetical protein
MECALGCESCSHPKNALESVIFTLVVISLARLNRLLKNSVLYQGMTLVVP